MKKGTPCQPPVIRNLFAGLGMLIVSLGASPGFAQDVDELNGASRVVVEGLTGRLNIRATPSLDGAIVDRAAAGATLGNAGCEPRGERLWCNVTLLDGSGRSGWAAADYLVPVTVRTLAESGAFDRIGRLDCRPTGSSESLRCDYGLVRDENGQAALVVYLSQEITLLLVWDGTTLVRETDDGDLRLDIERQTDGLVAPLSEAELIIPLELLDG